MGRGRDDDSIQRIEKKKDLSLGALFDQHQSPALLFSQEGQILASNASAQDYFACREQDFLDLRLDDLLEDSYSVADLERKKHKKSHLFFKRDSSAETAVWETANVLPGQHMWIIDPAPEIDFFRPALSEREQQILSIVADGANNGEIAHAFGIAPTTVQQHIASLKKKLKGATGAQMIERAIAHRFLHPRTPNETSLVQKAKKSSSPDDLFVTYIDHNSLARNPRAIKFLNGAASDLIKQDSLHEDIRTAWKTGRRQSFIEREIQLAWQEEPFLAAGAIDPLPSDKFILRLVF